MDIHDSDPLRRLRAIMARLRDPDAGCPWDQAQTPASIVPYTLEEAYEVGEAIASGESEAIQGELGDLLFQVVFQARLAEETGDFDFDDVARVIGDKLLRRHPHVFADAEYMHDHERETAWESAKEDERRARDRHGALDDIPLAMPALARAQKLQRRARRVGFDWDEAAAVLGKIREEIAEVQAEFEQGGAPERVADEVGDVLFAVVNWARHLNVDAETALRGSNRKFERRFREMETLAETDGRGLSELSMDELEALWAEAKRSEEKDPLGPPLKQGFPMSHVLEVPDHFMPARIEHIESVTPLIKVFNLVADPARFRARAGQWLDLAIPSAGEPLIGGYSVVSAPSADGRLQLAIKYADHHDATHHLHTFSAPGDEVFITAGQGSFYFERGMSREVVLLGAGIGVTPLMSILRYIDAEAPDVHVHLVYSVASRREVLFANELAERARSARVDVTLTVTREAEDWLGHTGRISHPLLESLQLSREALYYYCGSRDFIDDMTELLREWGLPESQLRYEKWW